MHTASDVFGEMEREGIHVRGISAQRRWLAARAYCVAQCAYHTARFEYVQALLWTEACKRVDVECAVQLAHEQQNEADVG